MPNPKPSPLTLLLLLETFGRLSESQVAERMGIDPAVAREYAAALHDIGLAVEREPLPSGEVMYTLLAGKQLPPMMLRDNEIVAIVAALKFAQGLDGGGAGVTTALDKLQRFLPARLVERIEDARHDLENAALFADEDEDEDEGEDDYYDGRSMVSSYIATFTRAIQEHRQVAIRYYSWGSDEESKRTIDPYGLAQHKSKWYVVGYCNLRKDLRVFRLDNIRTARLLTHKFDPPIGFDAVEYVAASFANLIPAKDDQDLWSDSCYSLLRRYADASAS